MPASSESAGNSPRPLDSTWSERLLPLRSFRALYSNIVVTTRRENIYRRGGGDQERPRLPRPLARRPSVSVARQKRRNRLSNRVSGAAGQNRKKAGSHSASQSLLLPRARSLLCQLKFLCGRFRWQNLRMLEVVGSLSNLESIFIRCSLVHFHKRNSYTPPCIFRAGEGINQREIFIILPRSCRASAKMPRRPACSSITSSLPLANQPSEKRISSSFDLSIRPFVRYFARSPSLAPSSLP